MTFNEKLLAMLRSRRFLNSAAGVVAIVLSSLVGLDETQVLAISGIVISWVVGDSIRETK